MRDWIPLREIRLSTERDESAVGPPTGNEIHIQSETVCDEKGIDVE